MDWIFLLYR